MQHRGQKILFWAWRVLWSIASKGINLLRQMFRTQVFQKIAVRLQFIKPATLPTVGDNPSLPKISNVKIEHCYASTDPLHLLSSTPRSELPSPGYYDIATCNSPDSQSESQLVGYFNPNLNNDNLAAGKTDVARRPSFSISFHSDQTLNDHPTASISHDFTTVRDETAVVVPGASVVDPLGMVVELARPKLDYPDIHPILPSQVNRYFKNIVIEPKESCYTIGACQASFSLGSLPDGWISIVQPEGQPFFMHGEKTIVTETWIWDHRLYTKLEYYIKIILDLATSYWPELKDKQLVVNLTGEDEGVFECHYYFVCHEKRVLLWLQDFNISDCLCEVQGDLSLTQIKNYVEYEYWFHWDLYPQANEMTPDILDLLESVLQDAETDILTSNQSTVNHSSAQLQHMKSIVKAARIISGSRHCSGWFVGRFMALLSSGRFLNFHGENGARLSRKQTVHGQKPDSEPHSIITKILSPLLFCAPDIHLSAMEGLWVDKLTIKQHWKDFFSKLNEEWIGHTVYASILLNANVAFLAIPDATKQNFRGSSLVQIASYLSIIASTGSIMMGLLLVRQHKTRELADVQIVARFLLKRDHSITGLQGLAIMYSLPYALLIWGMVTFLVAFTIMCFQSMSLATQITIGVAWLLNVLLFGWCIHMSWEESGNRWERKVLRIKDFVFTVVRKTLHLQNTSISGASDTQCHSEKARWRFTISKWSRKKKIPNLV